MEVWIKWTGKHTLYSWYRVFSSTINDQLRPFKHDNLRELNHSGR